MNFLKLTGAFFLGIIALAAASVIFFLALPIILPITIGTLLLVMAFLIIWAVVYVAMLIGVAIYYFFKPMEFKKEDKGYSVKKTKESGRREKGESK